MEHYMGEAAYAAGNTRVLAGCCKLESSGVASQDSLYKGARINHGSVHVPADKIRGLA